MTDPDLRAALQQAATTYPQWMNRADAVATWEFRRLVDKAAKLRVQSRNLNRWRMDGEGLLRDMDSLQAQVESRAA